MGRVAHHSRHDEYEEGSAQPTTKEEINQGITAAANMGAIKSAIRGMVRKKVDKDPADPPKVQRRSNRTTTTMTSKRPTPPPPIQIALPITGDNNRAI